MAEETFTRAQTQDNFVTEKVDVIKNNLLGSYDDNNNYFISPQIINELLEMKKYQKSTFENSMYCFGNLLGYGEIIFQLEFNDKTSDGVMASSTLYVLENVEKINGYIQNVIKTKIGEYSASVTNFIVNSYKHFNIFENTEDNEGKEKKLLDDLEEVDSFILAKKQFMLLLDKLSSDEMLDEYGKYFSDKITALTKLDNDFTKAILEKFNDQYDMIEKLFLTDKNYKTLNELLDKCIEEVTGTQEIFKSQQQEFENMTKDSLNNFTEHITSINDKNSDKAFNLLDKDDKEKVKEILDSEQEHNNNLEPVVENESVDNNGGNDAVVMTESEQQVVEEVIEPTPTSDSAKQFFGLSEEESQEEESKETELSEENQEQVNEVQEEIVVKQESEAQQESEVQQENSELANTLLARAAELSKQNNEEESKTIESDSSQIQETKESESESANNEQSIEDSNETKYNQPKYKSFAEGFAQFKSLYDKKQEETYESRENNNPHRDDLENTEGQEVVEQPSNTFEDTPDLSEEDEMLGDLTIGESVDEYKGVSYKDAKLNNNQNPEQSNENIDNNINQTTENTPKQTENVTGLDMFR